MSLNIALTGPPIPKIINKIIWNVLGFDVILHIHPQKIIQIIATLMLLIFL